MKYQVKILPGAIEDARALYSWIAEKSPTDAAAWFNGLFPVIDSLSTMPLRTPRAPESDILGIEIRHYIYKKNYRILYIVDGDTVRIIHIRHGAQQWMTKEEFSSLEVEDSE